MDIKQQKIINFLDRMGKGRTKSPSTISCTVKELLGTNYDKIDQAISVPRYFKTTDPKREYFDDPDLMVDYLLYIIRRAYRDIGKRSKDFDRIREEDKRGYNCYEFQLFRTSMICTKYLLERYYVIADKPDHFERRKGLYPIEETVIRDNACMYLKFALTMGHHHPDIRNYAEELIPKGYLPIIAKHNCEIALQEIVWLMSSRIMDIRTFLTNGPSYRIDQNEIVTLIKEWEKGRK